MTQQTDTSWRLAPMAACEQLRRGNDRFVAGRPEHPGKDAAKRAEISARQWPCAIIVGCSDSRVAAEIIFDQGSGDLFVVRTAGHVVDSSVLRSIEFGVSFWTNPDRTVAWSRRTAFIQAASPACPSRAGYPGAPAARRRGAAGLLLLRGW